MSEIHAVFKALGDPCRQAMVERLSMGPASVGELAEGHDLTPPAITKHISVLVGAGLVQRTKQGRRIICTLRAEPLTELADWLTDRWAYWASGVDHLPNHSAFVDLDEDF